MALIALVALYSRRLTHASILRQLRDLVICPDKRGVVNYVQDQSIMERDLTDPSSVSLFLSPDCSTPLFLFAHHAPSLVRHIV